MASSDRSTPHDALFKDVFSDREAALVLLRGVVAPELLEAIDPASLEVERASFIDEDLRATHSDLVFSAQLRGQDAIVYVLVEHQSSIDPLMPLRMLRYVVRIWEAWLREHADARAVPMVLPIVLHQGRRPWNGPTRVSELIALTKELLCTCTRYVPDMEFVLYDLGRVSPQALAALSGPPAARLTLIVMQAVSLNEDLDELLLRWRALAIELVRESRGIECLRRVVRYIWASGRVDVGLFRKSLRKTVGREATSAVMTTEQYLIDKGEKRGLKKGEKRGLKKGLVEALRLLLDTRFGDLDALTTSRLEGASNVELKRWLKRAVKAKRLEDVFRSPRRRGSKSD